MQGWVFMLADHEVKHIEYVQKARKIYCSTEVAFLKISIHFLECGLDLLTCF